MLILGVQIDHGGVGFYRVNQPLSKLRDHGLHHVCIYDYLINGWKVDAFTEAIVGADVIVLPRPHNQDWFKIIQICRKHGKIVVLDHDDDVFSLSPFNRYYRWVGIEECLYQWPDGREELLWANGMKAPNGEVVFDIEKNIRTRDMLKTCMMKSDAVSVTTPVLAETMSKYNKNVLVLPNLVDLDLFKQLPLQKDPNEVRIGWQGGHSHYGDLYMVRDQLKEVMDRNPNVTLVLMGGDVFLEGIFKNFDWNRIEYHEWVQNRAYPYKLPTLNLDIGLAPIVDDKFNRNKSAIKWMEYTAVGVPTIASDIPPYSTVIKNGETGILAGKEDWVEAIELLIKDPKFRKRLSERAYEDVYENHNSDKQVIKYAEAYESLVKGEKIAWQT